MKKKVTLRELVGTQIIYAFLVAVYYWMWARRDWHEYYITIQFAVAVFTCLFLAIQADRIRKYHKEEKDELAVQNLRRVDSLCMKIMTAASAAIAFLTVLPQMEARLAGYALVGMIFVVTVVRFAAFCIMDSKGI